MRYNKIEIGSKAVFGSPEQTHAAYHMIDACALNDLIELANECMGIDSPSEPLAKGLWTEIFLKLRSLSIHSHASRGSTKSKIRVRGFSTYSLFCSGQSRYAILCVALRVEFGLSVKIC